MHAQPLESIILLVDDEPVGRAALESLLLLEGYRLEFAADGSTALRAAADLHPDLILLDVMMPGMDGFEVTRRVRATPSLAEIPILLVTALDDPRSRLAGIEAGADDFITKPYDRVELRARVRAITRLNRYRRLTEERERYRHMFESSPCGLVVIDRDGDIRESNSVARALLDMWLAPTPAPRSLLRQLPPDQSAGLADMLVVAGSDPAAAPRAEFVTHGANGAPFWVDITVSRLPTEDAGGFQLALTDRTPERVLEVELRHAQKLESIGQLAGGIAHDFNNLLTVINGFSAFARDQLAPNDPVRESLEQVYKAGERAAALTRQLLTFSRRDLVAPVELNLNNLLRETGKMLGRLIGEHIAVRTQLTPALGHIKADPGQIEQIVFNLAVNARDAMPGGGGLTIETLEPADSQPGTGAPKPQWVRLVVSDTGCGMPPDVRARIFEPFFTTKEPGKGTGLGLATVYGIVQQCGGRIRVDSEVGRGTRFTVDFPRLENPARPGDSATDQFEVKSGTETILLAEDEDAVRTFARTVLSASGYTVLTACDGEDALETSRNHPGPIHLLLTDAVMPRLGGRGLAERLLKFRPAVRVLVTSGYDDAVAQHGGSAGAIAFLQKPYTTVKLLQKVREVLDQ